MRIGVLSALAFAALVVGLVVGRAAEGFHEPENVAVAQRSIAREVRSSIQEHRVPGAAVALVHDRRVVWARGFGVKDVRTNAPVTTDTRFQVASVSKAVSAYGLLRYAEEHHISLDAPLETHAWRPPPSRFDAAKVTLRRILSHTAGFNVPGYVGLPPDKPIGSLTDSLNGKTGDAPAVKLTAEPGTRVAYSGGGYTVAELWATEVANEPFTSFMKFDVLLPLGMRASDYDQRDGPDDATGHDAGERPLPAYRFAEHAAASLRATAPDMARFVAAIPRQMLTAAPATDGAWATGLELRTLGDGTKMGFHIGNNRGWQARIATFPDKGWGLVVLTNSDNGGDVYEDVLRLFVN